MSDVARGLLLVVSAGFLFILFIVTIRLAGTSLNPVQAAFLRYALGVAILLPMMIRSGWAVFYTRRPLRHALRGGVHGAGVLLWFYAITSLPIAEVTALGYTSPIFVTIGAILFLGERARAATIIAVIIGFAGVLVIVRPGFETISLGAIAILCSAPLFACSQLLVKTLVREDSSITTVIYLSLFATLTISVPALSVWQAPGARELALLALAAGFATSSHVLLAQGLKWVDVSLAQPAEFLRLVWATLAGFVLFGEVPGVWVLVGSVIVVGSVTIAAHAALGETSRAARDR